MSNVHQINTTYQMNGEIQIDKTALKPYIVLIEVHYLNNEFRERIQNIVERYRPAFQVRRKNILKRILQKDNLDIKLVSYVNQEHLFSLTGNVEKLYGLHIFNFENDSFSFLKRDEAEEALSKMNKLLKKYLDNEAIIFRKIK